jgi:hypothetical protein
MFETKDLLAAAEDPHRDISVAVYAAAFRDFHGDHPLIELRDPEDIARPWRPGSEITARQNCLRWPGYTPTSATGPAVRQPNWTMRLRAQKRPSGQGAHQRSG